MTPRRTALLAAPPLLAAALVLGGYIQTAGHPFEMVRPLAVATVAALAVTLVGWALVRHLLLAVWIGVVIVSWILGRELALLSIGIGLGVMAVQRYRRWRNLAPVSVSTTFVLGPPLALLGVAIYQLLADGIVSSDDFPPGGPPRAAMALAGNLPSMYVLLLDGYPRADELRTAFGYDNGPFIDQLDELGFEIQAEATSAFGGTSWTLASTMLEDAAELGPYADIDSTPELWASLRALRRQYLVNVPMMDRLRGAGYRLDYVASGVDLSEWRGWDTTHDSGQLTDTEALLIQRSPLTRILDAWVMEQLRSRIEASLQGWAETSLDPRQKVSFAHVMSPHMPFLWGSEGRELPPRNCWYARRCSLFTVLADQLELSHDDYGEHLGWQLEAINQRVIGPIRMIVTADPEAIVVVMSDHGARFEARSPERHHTFLATRIPHEPDLLASSPGPDGLFVRLLDSVTR